MSKNTLRAAMLAVIAAAQVQAQVADETSPLSFGPSVYVGVTDQTNLETMLKDKASIGSKGTMAPTYTLGYKAGVYGAYTLLDGAASLRAEAGYSKKGYSFAKPKQEDEGDIASDAKRTVAASYNCVGGSLFALYNIADFSLGLGAGMNYVLSGKATDFDEDAADIDFAANKDSYSRILGEVNTFVKYTYAGVDVIVRGDFGLNSPNNNEKSLGAISETGDAKTAAEKKIKEETPGAPISASLGVAYNLASLL